MILNSLVVGHMDSTSKRLLTVVALILWATDPRERYRAGCTNPALSSPAKRGYCLSSCLATYSFACCCCSLSLSLLSLSLSLSPLARSYTHTHTHTHERERGREGENHRALDAQNEQPLDRGMCSQSRARYSQSMSRSKRRSRHLLTYKERTYKERIRSGASLNDAVCEKGFSLFFLFSLTFFSGSGASLDDAVREEAPRQRDRRGGPAVRRGKG